jgi:hypothetical protein
VTVRFKKQSGYQGTESGEPFRNDERRINYDEQKFVTDNKPRSSVGTNHPILVTLRVRPAKWLQSSISGSPDVDICLSEILNHSAESLVFTCSSEDIQADIAICYRAEILKAIYAGRDLERVRCSCAEQFPRTWRD